MQARRLRLNRHHRQLSTKCTGNPEQTISDGHDRSVFKGLSQPDSSLESLAAIPALANEQCNFRALDLQLLPPGDSLLKFSFPGSAAAADINGLICYFPAGGPFRLRGENVNSCLVDIRHIFESGVQG